MNRLITICLLVVLGAGSAAYATTTSQIWYFNTNDVMPVPDVVNNDYGDPLMRIDQGTGTGFDETIAGRTGVWSLSGEIDVIIPNSPVLNPYKKITINLIWAPGGVDPFMPDQPLVGVVGLDVPDDAMPVDEPVMEIVSIINDPFAGTPWVLSIYEIIIRPNPPKEWIAIKGDILVDELGIRTECVPEPATVGLLGLGGLALLRSRRKR
jgi:hypothetical protein